MLDEALRHDLGHDLIGVVDALAPLIAECEGERRGEVGRVGGGQFGGGARGFGAWIR